jgi:phenylacetate-CoA ligase
LKGNLREVLTAIRDFRPQLLSGLPNLLFILADYAISHGIEPIPIPLVTSMGEMNYPHLAAARERIFPGRFFEYYANRENTIGAWGRGDGVFAEVSEYCHLEMQSDDGDGTGDCLSTSLHNFAFPLIRYNSGDRIRRLGYRGESRYPQWELIGGRGKDLLVSRDGLIAPHVYGHLRRGGFFKVKRCQLEQIDLDRVLVRIVPWPEYDRREDEATLLRLVSEALLDRFTLQAEYVDDVTYTKRGKYRPVISQLATRYLEENYDQPAAPPDRTS